MWHCELTLAETADELLCHSDACTWHMAADGHAGAVLRSDVRISCSLKQYLTAKSLKAGNTKSTPQQVVHMLVRAGDLTKGDGGFCWFHPVRVNECMWLWVSGHQWLTENKTFDANIEMECVCKNISFSGSILLSYSKSYLCGIP